MLRPSLSRPQVPAGPGGAAAGVCRGGRWGVAGPAAALAADRPQGPTQVGHRVLRIKARVHSCDAQQQPCATTACWGPGGGIAAPNLPLPSRCSFTAPRSAKKKRIFTSLTQLMHQQQQGETGAAAGEAGQAAAAAAAGEAVAAGGAAARGGLQEQQAAAASVAPQ